MAIPDAAARKPALSLWLLAAFALAIVWRAWFIANLPMLSRDGVDYIDYAQRLQARGIAAVRDADFEQHPLFPATIAIVQPLLRAVAGVDSPLVWQRSGQFESLLCGGVVLLLIAALARRVVAALELPFPPDRVAAIAVLLGGILPLNVWLSADVMSEQLFLVFYLGACLAMCRAGVLPGLFTGLLAGAAFLTRPEAIALLPGVAAVAAHGWTRGRRGRAFATAALALLGFGMVAAPYWGTLGRFSPKAEKQTVSDSASAQQPPISYARLDRSEVSMIVAPWHALLETARAGRVAIVALAIPVLVSLRPAILRSPLIALAVVALVHFAMIALLRYRHGYLSPRHALVIVELLIPLAAIALAYLATLKPRWLGPLVMLAASAPLAFYATRFPDEQNRHLLPAAQWVRATAIGGDRVSLLGPRSHSRLAFYADARFVLWHDEAATMAERLAVLRETALRERVALISLELGPTGRENHERAGNAEMLVQLSADGISGAPLEVIYDQSTSDGARIVILEPRWN
ncbi:MAG: hypothetical protein ACKVS9_19500 [Phycisphaerae bacterium]